jgi:hypothetical protein
MPFNDDFTVTLCVLLRVTAAHNGYIVSLLRPIVRLFGEFCENVLLTVPLLMSALTDFLPKTPAMWASCSATPYSVLQALGGAAAFRHNTQAVVFLATLAYSRTEADEGFTEVLNIFAQHLGRTVCVAGQGGGGINHADAAVAAILGGLSLPGSGASALGVGEVLNGADYETSIGIIQTIIACLDEAGRWGDLVATIRALPAGLVSRIEECLEDDPEILCPIRASVLSLLSRLWCMSAEAAVQPILTFLMGAAEELSWCMRPRGEGL